MWFKGLSLILVLISLTYEIDATGKCRPKTPSPSELKEYNEFNFSFYFLFNFNFFFKVYVQEDRTKSILMVAPHVKPDVKPLIRSATFKPLLLLKIAIA